MRVRSSDGSWRVRVNQVTLWKRLGSLGVWFLVLLRLRRHPEEHPRHARVPPNAVEAPRLSHFRLSLERALFSQQLPLVLALGHVTNVIAMTIASAGMAEVVRDGTHYVNLIITAAFAVKTAAQLSVLGLFEFGASWSRVLEGVVTLISLVRPSRSPRASPALTPTTTAGGNAAAGWRTLRRERAALLLRDCGGPRPRATDVASAPAAARRRAAASA